MQYGAGSVHGAGEKGTVNGRVKHITMFQLLRLDGVQRFCCVIL